MSADWSKDLIVSRECPHCKGTGGIQHGCSLDHLQLVRRLDDTHRLVLTIWRCGLCGQLWKLRQNYAPEWNTVRVRPGEEKDGLTFPVEEAEAYR